jgi:hypothetical protein
VRSAEPHLAGEAELRVFLEKILNPAKSANKVHRF